MRQILNLFFTAAFHEPNRQHTWTIFLYSHLIFIFFFWNLDLFFRNYLWSFTQHALLFPHSYMFNTGIDDWFHLMLWTLWSFSGYCRQCGWQCRRHCWDGVWPVRVLRWSILCCSLCCINIVLRHQSWLHSHVFSFDYKFSWDCGLPGNNAFCNWFRWD